MNNMTLKKKFFIGIVIIIVILIAFIFGFDKIEFSTFYYGLNVMLIVIMIILLLKVYKILMPIYLANIGLYDEAIMKLYNFVKNYNEHSSLRNLSLYNIAIFLNRKGDFEESICYLKMIDIKALSKKTKGLFYALYAINLMLLEKEHKIADEYINKSYELIKSNNILLYKTYFEVIRGNLDKADEVITKYFNAKNKKIIWGLKAVMIFDKFSINIENNYMVGVYYLKKNDFKLAEQYLSIASKCEYKNFYSHKAKMLIKQL